MVAADMVLVAVCVETGGRMAVVGVPAGMVPIEASVGIAEMGIAVAAVHVVRDIAVRRN